MQIERTLNVPAWVGRIRADATCFGLNLRFGPGFLESAALRIVAIRLKEAVAFVNRLIISPICRQIQKDREGKEKCRKKTNAIKETTMIDENVGYGGIS